MNPHESPQQILSLSRLPFRHVGKPLPCRVVPPILSGPKTYRHLSHPEIRVAAPGLAGVTHPHRRCCDETEPIRARPSAVLRQLRGPASRPGPLTLLPAARSPSRRHCCAPLVRSCRTVSASYPAVLKQGRRAGLFSVAVVVTRQSLAERPHLLFHGAAFPGPCGRGGSREVPPRRIRDPTGRRFTGKQEKFNTRGTQCQKQ